MLAFASADLLHTSGFVAVYLCGLVLGNAPLPHRSASIGFAEGMASLAQIGLFVLLGLLVSPGRLAEALGPALLVGGALLLVARPLSVVASLVWFRFPWPQQLFISWAGLRGAVPIVLATFPLTARGAGRDLHLRHRVRARRRLHPGAGLVAALGRPPPGDRHPADARATSSSSPRRWTSSTPT